MSTYYTFDANKVPIPCFDFMEWAEWFETAERRVARTESGDWWVSTVFLGMDHNFRGDGDPILFETMVFWDGDSGDMDRYRTWAEAEAGHDRIVTMLVHEQRQATRASLAALQAIARSAAHTPAAE